MTPSRKSKLVIELFLHGHSKLEIARALAEQNRDCSPSYMGRYVANVIRIAKRRGVIPAYTPEPATTG